MSAAAFSSSVGVFMLVTAAPYMVQRTVFESINERSRKSFGFRLELELRLSQVLADGGAEHEHCTI